MLAGPAGGLARRARHAAERGCIAERALPAVGGAAGQDEGVTPGKVSAAGVATLPAVRAVLVEHPDDLP